MDMTKERINCTFDRRDMLLSLHIGFSFVRAAVAFEPSSETVASKYLKLVTAPSFYPLTLRMDVTGRLAFSTLISMLYLGHVLSRFSTMASSYIYCPSFTRASMP